MEKKAVIRNSNIYTGRKSAERHEIEIPIHVMSKQALLLSDLFSLFLV